MQGWPSMQRWITNQITHQPNRPSYMDSSILTLHINGNHWAALNKRLLGNRVQFFYADDLNSPTIENQACQAIYNNTSTHFCPPDALWITCDTPKFQPHSNECGPHTILALAVLASYHTPHSSVLQQYITHSLAQLSRTWMGLLLTIGTVHLLPPTPETPDQWSQITVIQSRPNSLIKWDQGNTPPANSGLNLPTPSKQSRHHAQRTQIISPLHTILKSIETGQTRDSAKAVSIPRMCHQQINRQDTSDLRDIIIMHAARTNLSQQQNRTTKPHRRRQIQLTLPAVLGVGNTAQSTGEQVWGHHPAPVEDTTLRIAFNDIGGLK